LRATYFSNCPPIYLTRLTVPKPPEPMDLIISKFLRLKMFEAIAKS